MNANDLMSDTVDVAYVGNKKKKEKSGYVWTDFGSVRSVPKKLAGRLLSFPSEFVEPSKLPGIKQELEESISSPSGALELMSQAIAASITEGVGYRALEMAMAQLGTDLPASGLEVNSDSESSEDGSLIDEIKQAIMSVDLEDTGNFTSGGKLRVEVVEAVLGRDVTREQVDIAYSELD